MADDGIYLIISDDGGVYTEDGDYQPLFKDLLLALSVLDHPIVGFVQTRMMPASRRMRYERSYHAHIRALDDQSAKELLSFNLKDYKIDFSSGQLNQVTELLDGSPVNIKLAVSFIRQYGIDALLIDPSELLEIKRRRGEDFLVKIDFDNNQEDILSILSEYRYLATEMILSVLGTDSQSIAQNLRRLEEFCCIERRGHYYHISASIREAVQRDKRFTRSEAWKQGIGSKICDAIKDYQDDDSVPVAILDSATLAAARGANAPTHIAALILPSHLLRIARDYYNTRRYADCAEFCKRSWASRDRLTKEGQIEVLRLWSLSAGRLGDQTLFSSILVELGRFNISTATRVAHFVRGFNHRLRGELEDAEREFLGAWRLANNNQSINRELASLLCRQKRYSEAEGYARAAYKDAPTNPFILDVLAETLLGKAQSGLPVDGKEVETILRELQIYGDAPGSSFYWIRIAQQKLRSREYPGALSAIDKAIERTPALLAPYFLRCEIRLGMNDVSGAARDHQQIEQKLEEAGNFSKEDEAQAAELRSRIMIERYQFKDVKNLIEKNAFFTNKVKNRLLSSLARAIAYNPEGVDLSLREWSKVYSSRPQAKHSKGRRPHGN